MKILNIKLRGIRNFANKGLNLRLLGENNSHLTKIGIIGKNGT
jgi:hypothetical protein